MQVLFITFFQAFSQSYPQKLWDKRYGGFGGDQTFAAPIKIAKDGNLLFLGECPIGLSGDLSTVSKGSGDFWLFKIDTSGVLIWEKGIGSTNWDFARDFVELDDGGFLIVGYTSGGIGGDKTEPSRGDVDFWIVRLDSLRNILWDKTYGGNTEDVVRSVSITNDGGFLIAGKTRSKQGFDVSEPGFNPGLITLRDFWVLKLDSLGNKLWDKRYGTDGDEECYTITNTLDGNYLLIGWTSSYTGGHVSQPSRGGQDYWVLKIDTIGNKIWDARFGSSDNDMQNYTSQATPDGGFITCGLSSGPADYDKSENLRGMRDYWVVKCDSLGIKQWDKTLGGAHDEVFSGIAIIPSGGFLVYGSSKSQNTGDKTQNNWPGSSNNMWAVKLSENGTIVWDVRWGGNVGEYAASAVVNNGVYYLYGGTFSNISGDKSQNNWSATPVSNPASDLWIVAFTEPPLGYENLGDSKGGIDVFPNPFREMLEVGAEFKEPGKVLVELFDITGRKVFGNYYSISTAFFNKEIELGFLKAGVYSLAVTTSLEKRTRLVVKK